MSKATVVMATHNPDPRLLRRQVQSLRAQTIEDWHCLVFDDASSDPGLARSVVGDDCRFEVLDTLPHLGHYAAFEHLLEHAPESGPVFLCDQDDYWHPDKLKRMLPVLEAGADAVFSSMRVVDSGGALVRERFMAHEPDEEALRPANLLLMNCVSGAALGVSMRTVQAALPFPAPEARGWHDQWLAAVAARIGSLVYLPEQLVDYTRHRQQVVGDGLRSLNPSRVRAYARRAGSRKGLRNDLRDRTRWISAAADRLLVASPDPDPSLTTLADGGWSMPLASALWQGWRRGDVPASRALLLAAGFPLS
jgi:glycosyltransferase involved in cell wall biosynthesis